MSRIFGNRERLGIEIRPLAPSWPRRYLAEQTAWATLLFWVHGTNLCRHTTRGTDQVEEGLNVPLAPIADWMVRSWSAILFEERARSYASSDQLHWDLSRWVETPPPAGLDAD